MNTKLAIYAVALGLAATTLLIVVPLHSPIKYFEGFSQPKDTDFIDGPKLLCTGVNFQVYQSVFRVGYPAESEITINYNDCTPVHKLDSALPLLLKSVVTVSFYVNWLFWSVASYGILLLWNKLIVKQTEKRHKP